MPKRDISGFIAHWSAASPSERANSQAFLLELCDLLEVPKPDNHPHSGYFFEYPVTEQHADGTSSSGRIDLYKRACFVLESKQFQEAKAEASQLELAAEEAGVIEKKKFSQPVRGTNAWDDAMVKARGQAERYVRALPDDNPPFVIVVDVGHTFEVFADFTQAGKAYLPFPDPRTFRFRLADLADEKIRERLRLIWTNPAALDPAKRSADVTREVSGHLAELAKSLELAGHAPDLVAQFLTRCLFCMFAEDVELLPRDSFTELLQSLPASGEGFQEVMQQLFREMDKGTGRGVSVVLRKKLLHFNGGLFADDTVLPINGLQLGLLKEAARQNWGSVEPAIFGTLLERALNPDERHKLGAHFTPRAYVERLVLPAVIEPLRAEWANVRAAAFTHGSRSSAKMARSQELIASSLGKQKAGDLEGAKEDFRLAKDEEKNGLAEIEKARAAVNEFHERLCNLKVLDPACGVGNFLYVSLQHLKILEGEVLDFAAQFGENFKLELATHTVDPHQFLGLEINPRAAAIAELVLWIGYLQWHFRLHGNRTPPEPILRAFKNIQCRDAVLAYDGEPQPVTWAMALENPDLPGLPDEVRQQGRAGSPLPAARSQANDGAHGATHPTNVITVWDRRSMKRDLVTGREVPDETKRAPLLTYANPRPAQWPQADFIVGNPPFIGNKFMREALGDGYAEILRKTYPEVPESADFVMYWWQKSAEQVRAGRAKRFGLITTNNLRQVFNRRVVQTHLSTEPKLCLAFAIPDHPWVDTADGAAVRIAMTVGTAEKVIGILAEVISEGSIDTSDKSSGGAVTVHLKETTGHINGDLTVGADVAQAIALLANAGLCGQGIKLVGDGFYVKPKDFVEGINPASGFPIIRKIIAPANVLEGSECRSVIDFFGLTAEEALKQHPEAYNKVLAEVRPLRAINARPSIRDLWWRFAWERPDLRNAISGLDSYLVTLETSKFRFFIATPSENLWDGSLFAIALDDCFFSGLLNSKPHVVWSLEAGGQLGPTPRYNRTACFETFPFPLCGEAEKGRIRKLAEELDAHRKRVQAQHGLTLTGLYNVLEKLRTAEQVGRVTPCAPSSQIPSATGGQRTDPPYQLTDKEKLIHDQGLVSVLKQLHDDLDAAVFAAYGWPATLTDAEILERLVALNAERAAEEKRGVIHWLRPEYQIKAIGGTSYASPTLNLTESQTKKQKKSGTRVTRPSGKTTWPKTLAERVQVVEAALHAAGKPSTPAELAKHFKRAKPDNVAEILETLVTLGRAHRKGSQFSP